MAQEKIENPEELIKKLENLNIQEIIDEYFSVQDKEKTGWIDADEFKDIFIELNRDVGIKTLGENEWTWMLNLIKKKKGDKLNKAEATDLYEKMVHIAKDYLYCLPPPPATKNTKSTQFSTSMETSNDNSSFNHKMDDNKMNDVNKKMDDVNKNNKKDDVNINDTNDIVDVDDIDDDNGEFKLIKFHQFECDSVKGKSINTLIDIDEQYFLATIGERGKALVSKSTWDRVTFKKDLGFYVTGKVSGGLLSAVNTEKEGIVYWIDFQLTGMERVAMSEGHQGWISKIEPLSENRVATSSGDHTIKIWEIEIDGHHHRLYLLETLDRHTSNVISIVKIQDKDLLISGGYDQRLVVWDLKSYTVWKEIEGIQCSFINGMKELPGGRVMVSGEKNLTIIDYLKGEVITKIATEVTGCCFEMIHPHQVLVGCFDGSYLELNLEDYRIQRKKAKESNYISCMKKLPNNILVVGLHNGIMKIYKY